MIKRNRLLKGFCVFKKNQVSFSYQQRADCWAGVCAVLQLLPRWAGQAAGRPAAMPLSRFFLLVRNAIDCHSGALATWLSESLGHRQGQRWTWQLMELSRVKTGECWWHLYYFKISYRLMLFFYFCTTCNFRTTIFQGCYVQYCILLTAQLQPDEVLYPDILKEETRRSSGLEIKGHVYAKLSLQCREMQIRGLQMKGGRVPQKSWSSDGQGTS